MCVCLCVCVCECGLAVWLGEHGENELDSCPSKLEFKTVTYPIIS